MHGRTFLAGMAVAAVAATAGAVVVDRTATPDTAGLETLSSERSAQASESVRQALADVEHALHVAQRARRIARVGRGKARTALATANSLLDQVEQALSEASTALANSNTALDQAGTALNQAQNANSRLDSTAAISRTAAGQAIADASNPDYQADAAGPRVTVTVPESGLIEVWATVTVESDEGAVGLFEDGQLVQIPGQDGACDVDDAILMSQFPGPITISTPPIPQGGLCGSIGEAPGPVLFRRSPGTHTYELRYADCGCDSDDAVFSNRTLQVAPRL